MKFRKKPVVIEAVQLRWDNWAEMCDHARVGLMQDGKPEGTFLDEGGQPVSGATWHDGCMGLLIPTLEGLMIARQNDWVIRGVKGELYPCKPDIFEATYDAVQGEFCSSCGNATDYACADCRITLQKTIFVCSSPKCRDKHEETPDHHKSEARP